MNTREGSVLKHGIDEIRRRQREYQQRYMNKLGLNAFYKKREKRRKEDPEYKQKNSEYAKASQKKIKLECLAAYGNKCTCCEEDNPVFLCIDHKYNDGREERNRVGMGNAFYRYLRKLGYPKERYQILCFNCNNARRIAGVCPHQKEPNL